MVFAPQILDVVTNFLLCILLKFGTDLCLYLLFPCDIVQFSDITCKVQNVLNYRFLFILRL